MRVERDIVRRHWNERVVGPVTTSLRQGLTPERIARSLAWGAAVGLFPVVGTTTLLGLALAPALRLNLPLLQVASWAVYPLQLLLVLPLVRLGERLSGTAASLAATPPAALVSGEALSSLQRVGVGALNGVLGWITILPVVVLVLYQASLSLLRGT
jgi:uncharacterized protein (DUF2062 family)